MSVPKSRSLPEQAQALKHLSVREGKSVAELIRLSVDAMLRTGGIRDEEKLRRKASAAAESRRRRQTEPCPQSMTSI